MEQEYKEVKFEDYCKICKHELLKETDSPCDECLENPINQFTDRPVKWEGKS